MQTLTQLADAARAVITADRAGELTDDLINELSMAVESAAPEQAASDVAFNKAWQALGTYRHIMVHASEPEAIARWGWRAALDWHHTQQPATEQSGEAVAFEVTTEHPVHGTHKRIRASRADADAQAEHWRGRGGDVVIRQLGYVDARQPAPAVPEEWRTAVGELLASDGSGGIYDAARCITAHDKLRALLATAPGEKADENV
ncbi:hypothetical protein [Chromobacterium violaceum]|uniref:hypothetical protein n=1 Tax=Chromobacterium violaceum TaxID=536 RepID=UPI001CE06D37|nr:hypothetical protein [Chromobacterium violaceum]